MAKKKPASTQIEDALSTISSVEDSHLLHTGCTMLNLALTGKPSGGFPKGSYILLIGSSSSGKTFLSLTCFAEAALDQEFDDYRFIYDDVEGGALMDIEKFFGSKVADKIEPPRVVDGAPAYSQYLEDFYYNLDDLIKEAKDGGRPFIYVVDSIDALTSHAEQKKFNENKGLRRKGKDQKGSYGDGKAKINSQYIRSVVRGLRDTNSILLVINQERDNPDAGLFESSRTHSGGRSLKFYATAQVWFTKAKSIKRTVLGKERVIGNLSRIEVKKNRLTGKDRTVKIPIYYTHGLDDVGSCVEYMVEEGVWKKNKTGVVNPQGFADLSPSRVEDLVQAIEEQGLTEKLLETVTLRWREVENKSAVKRKKKYT